MQQRLASFRKSDTEAWHYSWRGFGALSGKVLRKIYLIQEPYVISNEVRSLSVPGHDTISVKRSGERPRACILFNRELKLFALPNLSTRDVAAATLQCQIDGKIEQIIIASVYLPIESPCPTQDLKDLVEYAERGKLPILIGCDSNAHHTDWGSTSCNSRGNSLADFLAMKSLCTANVGSKPTFDTLQRGKTIIDLTIVSTKAAGLISGWHVSDEATLSDHKQIRYAIKTVQETEKRRRQPSKTDWPLDSISGTFESIR